MGKTQSTVYTVEFTVNSVKTMVGHVQFRALAARRPGFRGPTHASLASFSVVRLFRHTTENDVGGDGDANGDNLKGETLCSGQ